MSIFPAIGILTFTNVHNQRIIGSCVGPKVQTTTTIRYSGGLFPSYNKRRYLFVVYVREVNQRHSRILGAAINAP